MACMNGWGRGVDGAQRRGHEAGGSPVEQRFHKPLRGCCQLARRTLLDWLLAWFSACLRLVLFRRARSLHLSAAHSPSLPPLPIH
jgi:hypothetical protein